MGLDLMLGAVVLLAGARGWFRGFMLQAIRLGALIGCVFAADPLRDLARPYMREHIPSMRPELLDKLLWWAAAVVSYLVASGLATWITKAYRSRAYGDFDRNNADQGAGFLLGAAKGLIVASFLASGIERYATRYLGEVAWAREQVDASQAMSFARSYHPADRIWASAPVRLYVAHVRRSGLELPEPDPRREAAEAPVDPRSPASPSPRSLELPQGRRLDPNDPAFLLHLDDELRR